MKKILYGALVMSGLILGSSFFQGCTTEIPQFESYEAYTYASVDADGGNWTPILLTSGSEVSIDAPADVTDAGYLSELAAVKSANGSISADQQEAIDYWGNNTVIRWMEIAEELVAKYNLAPAPDADGNYPGPDAANPSNYPQFPFAHPPYAVRAYAYLMAASYDAGISAWHYKYQYNRPAPYVVDGSIDAAYPDNGLPSYPSEDAAFATVAEKILDFMFPLEVEYIAGKAEECRNTRLWAGMNVESDLIAGDSIGSYVANKYIDRAKTDSMKFAQIGPDAYQAFEDNADATWGDQWPHWECLEIPQRPVGITPNYMNVKVWWIPSVEAVRCDPPPAVGSDEYNAAEQELLDLTKNCTHEQKEAAYFWSDGFGTYTPPGHWDKIAEGYILDGRLNPLRTARVFAYMNTTMMDAGIACWDTKYYYMYPRPSQMNPDIDVLIGIPNFPSYLSGHSMFSNSGASVLAYMFPEHEAEILDMAQEAADSRVYARIHWRFDAEVGVSEGRLVGSYAVAAAQADGAD